MSKHVPAKTRAKSTIIVTPRERFGVSELSLQRLAELTDGTFELVYIDGGSPRDVAGHLQAICEENGYRYLRHDGYLTPNAARNIGQRMAATEYVVFLDNDVIVSEGWLRALEQCADETGAEVVAPLTCQRFPLHQEIHQAGGQFVANLKAFLDGDEDARRITDIHLMQGQKVSDVKLERGESQCCEFHCALVRASAFERFGDLDENLMATKEHIDFCMTVWTHGGKVMFEPASVVTYLFPNQAHPLTMRDWPYFALRWSPRWQKASLDRFRSKWALDKDPYFETRNGMLDWRLKEGIVKPTVRKIPLVGRSHKGVAAATWILLPIVRGWSHWLAARHARRQRRLT
ncbi:MAG: glycosyltransferase [Hyphomonas sp.]